MPLQAKELHHNLKFKCQKCGYCCDHTIIELSPFDIKNICEHLNITTTEFHQKYSIFNFIAYPKCILKNRPHCPFKKNTCTIYQARPIRCRLYPLGRVFQDHKNSDTEFLGCQRMHEAPSVHNEILYVLPEEKCSGFASGKKQTIAEWLDNENISPFNQLTNEWNNFLIKTKENELDKVQTVIFKKVFYDFDDPLIQKYREQMKPETNLEVFMENLYQIYEILNSASKNKS
ncbi:MAG: YkgJ family cysteine cluster protein [Nanoarchaeota archaeon]|nr:YkgJ family cysteine cluster protein [Nanoarchaeota archaeon]MBU1622151.1 YkgJ family cysteine cluster protein [Nanoarchaeota archaeon]